VFAFACTVDVHVCLHLSVFPTAHLLQRQSHAQPRSTRVPYQEIVCTQAWLPFTLK